MIFRANEEKERGSESAVKYLSDRENPANHKDAKAAVLDIIAQYGPATERFPIWHPLRIWIDRKEGGKSSADFDHVIYLQRGFIACPYTSGRELKTVVAALQKAGVPVGIREIHAPLYQKKTTRWLVYLDAPLEDDGTLEKELVLRWLMKTYETHHNDWTCRHDWDLLACELLGTPCGKRSSLFVNQKTGQAIKEVWETIRKHTRNDKP